MPQEAANMKTVKHQKIATDGAHCPFVLRMQVHSGYAMEAFCRGLPHGLPMIPSVEECRQWCSKATYTSCPIYRSRMGEDGLEAWLRVQNQRWGIGLQGIGRDLTTVHGGSSTGR